MSNLSNSDLRYAAEWRYASASSRFRAARARKFDPKRSAALRNVEFLTERIAEAQMVEAKAVLDWLDLEARYNPDQPRVPAGEPDGGQWVGDNGRATGSSRAHEARVRLAQNAPRFWRGRSPSIRLNDAEPDLNLQDEVLVGAYEQSRDMAVRQAQAIDPTYRPQSGMYESVNGYLADLRAQREDAELFVINGARAQDGLPPLTRDQYLSPTSPSLTNTPAQDLLEPGGNPIGWRQGGADVNIRTVDLETFNDLAVRLAYGSELADARPGYTGIAFERADGSHFGLRISPDNGPTIDIFNYGFNVSSQVGKVHQK
jgi:hypothetical protein